MGKKKIFYMVLISVFLVQQISVPKAEASSVNENLSPGNGQEQPVGISSGNGDALGSVPVVGNRAVILMDGNTLPVYDGGGTAGMEGGRPMEFMGGSLTKNAIIDQRIVADQAYYRNQGMTFLNLPVGIQEIGQFSYARSALKQADIPYGTEIIGFGAFYHCDGLASVSLPETVMNVEPKAFAHTQWVEQFLMNGNGSFLVSGGVLVAYKGNGADLTVPEGVRVIAAGAFAGHSELVGVNLPDSLLVIGEGAFENCGNLSSVTGGAHIVRIKDRAFYGCPLNIVGIGDSVKEIGLGALAGAEAVVFNGKDIPRLSMETSAARLSNDGYRISPLHEVPIAMIGADITGQMLKGTVLHARESLFQGIICSLGEDDKIHCRFSNLTQEELLRYTVPATMTLGGAEYELVDRDGIQSLTIEENSPRPVPGNVRIVSVPEGGFYSGAAGAMGGAVGSADGGAVGSVDGITAVLEGEGTENRGYILYIEAMEGDSSMEKAYRRAFFADLPEDAIAYGLTLTDDESGIPIVRLGSGRLTVTMPLPDTFSGKDVQVVAIDRNGQLEAIPSSVSQGETGTRITFLANILTVYGFFAP